MLEVIEAREGNFEISDQFNDHDRKQIIFYKQLLQGAILFLIIFAIMVLRLVDNILLQVLVFLIFLGLIVGSGYFIYQFNLQLVEDISGFVLIFDANQMVTTIRVRRWLPTKIFDFSEEEVRFNQAIGFQAVLNDDGDILIEVIVDPDFPGTPIFKTYDMATLAEFILLFQKAIPDMDKWYYKAADGTEWTSEMKIELNQEMQLARVPWLIRKYYGF